MERYVCRLPFGGGQTAVRCGDLLDESIEQSIGFDRLVHDGYIESLCRASGEELQDVFVVNRSFFGNGIDWIPGDIVDLRETDWRNTDALISTGVLRRALQGELETAQVREGIAPSRLHLAETAVFVVVGDVRLEFGVSGSYSLGDLEAMEEHAIVEVSASTYKDEAYLRCEYLEKGRSLKSIGADWKVSGPTIGHFCRRFGIPLRTRGKPKSS